MATLTNNDACLHIRLPDDLKIIIEEAATQLGQSIRDYAVSTLVRDAKEVLQQSNITELTNRDRERFLTLLDDIGAKPNQALKAAVAKYKKQMA